MAFIGNGTQLTDLDAGDISAGTLAAARLPASGVNAASITTGTLAVAQGGTGTATPSIVAGSGISVSGTWPNQTVASSGGGVTSLNGQTGAITNTNYNVIGSYVSKYYGFSYPGENTTSGLSGLSGTWRLMGMTSSTSGAYGTSYYTLAVRIS